MVSPGGGQASLIGRSLGNYAVKALIGRGAMGTVYLARHETLGRMAALKVLLGSLARNRDQVKRFLLEAQAAAPLQHPNIVGIYEAGVLEGVPYIAMEYVEGEPLDRFLHRKGRMLSWQNALHILHQVSQALDCAHRAGVVHRDVKPANILLDPRGRVRLTDFGIANVGREQEEEVPDTPSAFLGTPEYMSPEQCAGSARITPASDLFSLGVMLFEMLSGQKPFEGHTTMALIKSITNDEPTRLNQIVPEIPDDVARLAAHLLQKDAKKRPGSARHVCATIGRLQRENGGASALPEALDAYIREETQPRRLRVDTPAPVKRRHGPRLHVPQRRRYYTPISGLTKVLVGFFVVCALIGVGYWHYLRPRQIPVPAPALDAMDFTRPGSGVIAVPLPSEAWRVAGLHWVGDRPVVVVTVEGGRGTMAQGAQGLLTVDPESHRVCSLRAPAGPTLDADYWRDGAPRYYAGRIPPMPPASPLFEAILVHAYAGPARHDGGTMMTLAQRWDEALPRAKVMHRGPAYAWDPSIRAPWGAQAAGQAAVSPDGHTVCLLLHDPATDSNYLAERDVRWRSLERMGPPLTAPGELIIPGTVQYSPRGSYIAYMRRKGAEERQLWAVASGGSEVNGNPLALGRLRGTPAFSPGEQRVAVSLDSRDGTRMALVRVDSGSIEAQPGLGQTESESWHPSKEYLVVAASEEDGGLEQLYAVETTPPFRRHALTHCEGGVRCGGAVSRDGRWAVAVAQTAQGQRLIFVDLSTVLFAV